MRKVNKIIITILIFFIIVFIAIGIAVTLSGKRIIEGQIEKNLKVKVKLEKVSFSLPLSISLKNLELGDFFQAGRISISPSMLGLAAGKIVLNKVALINPLIRLEQYSDGSLNLPKLAQNGKQPPILLTSLFIENGKLIFTDRKIAGDNYKIVADNITARIVKNNFPPTSLKVKFQASALISDIGENTLGNIDFSGWVDFRPKDMDGILNINGLEVTYFRPYYGDFISTRKLLSAKLNLTSLFSAQNNNLTIASKLRLYNLVYAKEEPQPTGEPPKLDLFKNALDLFTDRNGNLDLEFSINTKLDKPRINVAELKEIILDAATKNLSQQSPVDLIEKAKGIADQFKDFGKQMKEIFK